MINRVKRDFGLVDKRTITMILVGAILCGGLILWVWSITPEHERSGDGVSGVNTSTLGLHNSILSNHEDRIKELEDRIEELGGR